MEKKLALPSDTLQKSRFYLQLRTSMWPSTWWKQDRWIWRPGRTRRSSGESRWGRRRWPGPSPSRRMLGREKIVVRETMCLWAGKVSALTETRVKLCSSSGLWGVVGLCIESGLERYSHCQPKGTWKIQAVSIVLDQGLLNNNPAVVGTHRSKRRLRMERYCRWSIPRYIQGLEAFRQRRKIVRYRHSHGQHKGIK